MSVVSEGTPARARRSARSARAVRSVPLGIALALAASPLQAQLRPEIVRVLPHDRQAFTQGLLVYQGKFYESTGQYGRSSVRRVLPATGAVERNVALTSDRFGEGLALAGDRLIQLTWQNRIALVYDLELAPIGSFEYEGEGWGLCFDGTRLVMSDGSSRLWFRDRTSFALLGEVEVRRAGTPVPRLNELECVGPFVYANVWQTDSIVRIDPVTGDVLATIDASGLLSRAEAAAADVLNGIAYDVASGHFFITGKLWPKVFEVRFPLGDAGSSGTSGGRPAMEGADAGTNGGTAGANVAGGGAAAGATVASGGAGQRGTSIPSASPGTDVPSSGGGVKGGAPSRSSGGSSSCGCRLPAERGASGWLLALVLATTGVRAARRGFRRARVVASAP